MLSVAQLLDVAWQHFRSGRWQQAEQLFRQVIEHDPDQFDAWHLLGMIAGQTGRDALAIDCLKNAIRLRPGFAPAHNNLGNVFAAQRKLADAVACFRRAAQLQPDFALAFSNLGNALREQGELDEAVAALTQALRLEPDHPEAHSNLGIALHAQGNLAGAAASFRQALRKKPGDATAHVNLGCVLIAQELFAEAEAELRRALSLKVDHAEAHHRLGVALEKQGMFREAVAEYHAALRLDPHLVDAHVNLGNALRKQGRLEEAAAAYERAVREKPDDAIAHNNLGNLLRECGHLDLAEKALRQAVHAKPGYAAAHHNLGIVLWRQGRLDEALASYQRALREDPDHADAHLNIGNVFKDQGRLDEAIESYRAALRINPASAGIHGNIPFILHYHPGYDARAILEENTRWNDQHARPLETLIRPHTNSADPDRRLRIGYVSPDFHEHPIALLMFPLLSCHDHTRFEIVCYSNGKQVDAFTSKLRACAHLWRNTTDLSDQEIADQIREDQIDILVDLALHSANNRLLVFARKPAPVQVTWLGYPGTTGMSTIDYRLTDPHLDPPGLFDAFYSEESVRLPDTFWCYDPMTETPPVNELPATTTGGFTFGCLNNFCKVNGEVLAIWARVLAVVPGSRLLLRAPRGKTRDEVLSKFDRQGVAAARIEFADREPRQRYLERYHEIDLCLDPWPYNGHTTSLDAFWMGVPTLTLVGQTVVGRAGLSQLCNLGLEKLAVETPDQYVALAAQLAGDLPWLRELRSTLRERMRRSPLMDAGRFAHNIEQAYRDMWRRWCAQTAPAPAGAGNSPETPRGRDSDPAEAQNRLGHAYKEEGRLDDAIKAFRQALELRPTEARFHSSLLVALNLHPSSDVQTMYEEYRRWDEQYGKPLARLIKPHTNHPDPARRLRVGYVSPDFRAHPNSAFTIPLFSNHDHRQFEIFCYADVAQPDLLTEHIRAQANVWRDTVGCSDQQVADMVRDDQIDILVDLTMHTINNRLLMFARKPAPVQVAWLAYPGTTGLSTMDYRLTDPYIDPPGLFDAFYSEQSVRLPETFWCYDPLTDQPPVSDLPALANGQFTFGCLNYFPKVNDGCLRLWARVLRAVPWSRLMLLVPQGPARDRVLALLESEGIAGSRVEFAARQSRNEYLALYQRIDVGLDPFPCNGGTTTMDAFWMGVPTISLVGKTPVGRAGLSQASNLGLKELAAETPEQYVALAVQFASDLHRLRELRSTLRERMRRSPLMDASGFARNIEQAYREMWRRWCQQTRAAESTAAVPSPERAASYEKETRRSSAPPALDRAWKLYHAGQLPEAESLGLDIVRGDPNEVDAWQLLGVIAGQTGRDRQAIDYYQAVLRLKPEFGEAHFNVGNSFLAQGQLAEAIQSYQEAMRLMPAYPEAPFNLGIALWRQGRLDEAEASYRRALRLKPDHAGALLNLGVVLRAQGRLVEAAASLQQALILKPDLADAHLCLGNVYRAQGDLDNAIVAYRAALRLRPDFAEAQSNLGNVLKDEGLLDDAIAAYRAALQIKPDAADIHSNLVYTLVFHPNFDAPAIHEECRRWDQQHAAPLKRLIQPHRNSRDPDRRLRIGYVSPDFRDHAESFFTVPLLANHDHRQFEIFCYAQIPRPDAVTARLRGHADVWRETVGLSDQQLADLVRSDQIDILVDLAMHMANSRLLVFARKPAPVQVAWLAYPGTTGLSTMDYRLTDPYLDPPGLFDAFYAEESIRLPDTFACYDPLTDAADVSPLLPAFTNHVLTFGCLNNFCKINDGCLALWSKVLQAVPRSRLLLRAPGGPARKHLLGRFEQYGIPSSRVEFADKKPRADYLAHYHRIDVGLDPLPYNGITTTLDAFWMGVPTITLVGKTAVGRAGLSQLSNLGLQDLVAETPDQFAALAARLADDLPRLQSLRSTLRQRLRSSPLMDGARFARNMEKAYRDMWQRWCRR